MNQEAETPSRRAEHFMRKLAAHHAAAFREFGDALEEFDRGEISAGGVIKVAGDLYFRETARMASELIGAVSGAWDLGLTRAGVETEPAGTSGHHAGHEKRTPRVHHAK
jgi:hypothetical protein